MRHSLSLIIVGLTIVSCSSEPKQIRKPVANATADIEKNSADQQREIDTDDDEDLMSDAGNNDGSNDGHEESDEGGAEADGDSGGGSNDNGGAADSGDTDGGADAVDGGGEGNGTEGNGSDGAAETDGADGGMDDGMDDGMADGEVPPEETIVQPPPPPPAQVTPWRTLLKKVYRHRIAFHQLGLNRDNYYSTSNDPIRREGIIHYERAGIAFEVFERAPTAAEFPSCAPRSLVRCMSGGLNQANFVHYLAFQCPSNFTVAETLGFVCSQNGADRTRFLQFRDQFSWTHRSVKRTHAAYVISHQNPGAPWQVSGSDFFAPKR